jgi:hypothetical protein
VGVGVGLAVCVGVAVGSTVGVAVVATATSGVAAGGDPLATATVKVSNISAAIGVASRIRLRRLGGSAITRASGLGLGGWRGLQCWPFHCHLPSGEVQSFGIF